MKLWLLAVLTASLFAATEHYYEFGDLEVRGDGVLIDIKTQKPANGIGRFYYDSGKLRGETPFQNGLREGVAKTYYENGALKGEATFKNDKFEGLKKEFFDSGRIQSEVPFVNNEAEGIAKFYYESGKVQGETPFKKNKADGVAKFFTPTGKMARTIEFKEGVVVKAFDYDDKGTAKALNPEEIATAISKE